MDLETSVSQAVFAVRLLERALHDGTGWTMQWGEVEVTATRTVTDDEVVLTAEFPDVCLLVRPDGPLLLKHRGDVLGVRTMDHPGDGGFTMTWALRAQVDQVA